MCRRLIDARVTEPGQEVDRDLVHAAEQQLARLLGAIKQFTAGAGDETAIASELRGELETMIELPVLARRFDPAESQVVSAALVYLQPGLTDEPALWGSMLGWLAVHALGKLVTDANHEQQSRSWLDEWLLGWAIADTLRELQLDEPEAAVTLIKLLTSHQSWWRTPGRADAYRILEALMADSDVQRFLRVHRYQEVLWFHKESFERLLWWLLALAVVQISADPRRSPAEAATAIATCHGAVQLLRQAAERSGYQVEQLLEIAALLRG